MNRQRGGTIRGATIRVVDGHLLYLSDYHPQLVSLLKAQIPGADRAWDNAAKGWQVAAAHMDALQRITEQVLGEPAQVIGAPPPAAAARTTALKVEYIGSVKDRADGQRTATGFCNGGWNATFPEKVLLEWFGVIDRPDEKATLYQVLGVKPAATAEEVKKAWRRLALQWHPDRCREPDAAEQFLIIKGAWEVLGSEDMRRRYDAGLALEMSMNHAQGQLDVAMISMGFRPPLRCGWILAEVDERLPGRYAVRRIFQWEDIMDEQGRIMVPSWPAGADMFTVDWVEP